MSRSVSIYVLCEPDTDIVRYVGKTHKQLKRRLREHLWPSALKGNSHKKNWLKSLTSQGLKPDLKIVRIVDDENWEYYEKFYIDYYKSLGYSLVNSTDGGEGSCGLSPSPETRLKISQHHKATGCHPPNWIGRTRSPETKAKISSAHKGNPKNLEHKANLSRAKTGKPSPRKGTTCTEESRKKMSESAKVRCARMSKRDSKGHFVGGTL